jgi:hypothetical protein
MEMTPVKSSQVESIGYDSENKTLAVKFIGGVYHYADVPRGVYEDMLQAESVGGFLASAVKPNYKCAKQEPK